MKEAHKLSHTLLNPMITVISVTSYGNVPCPLAERKALSVDGGGGEIRLLTF